jgi:hypothetical protein
MNFIIASFDLIGPFCRNSMPQLYLESAFLTSRLVAGPGRVDKIVSRQGAEIGTASKQFIARPDRRSSIDWSVFAGSPIKPGDGC